MRGHVTHSDDRLERPAAAPDPLRGRRRLLCPANRLGALLRSGRCGALQAALAGGREVLVAELLLAQVPVAVDHLVVALSRRAEQGTVHVGTLVAVFEANRVQ